jgi:DNA-binding transcriptional LysR family regulator
LRFLGTSPVTTTSSPVAFASPPQKPSSYRLLTPHLVAFRQCHPSIVVEFAVDNRIFDLSRREADVALRPQRPEEGNLWGAQDRGRCLGNLWRARLL